MFIDPTLALLACFAMFAGCSTTAQQNVSTVATNVQTQVKKACGVWGGAVALDAMVLYSFDPKVDLAINSVNALCQANAIVDPSSVQTLAQTNPGGYHGSRFGYGRQSGTWSRLSVVR